MRISEAIQILQIIQHRFGDQNITGGILEQETPLWRISVNDVNGQEIWPITSIGVAPASKMPSSEISGVHMSS